MKQTTKRFASMILGLIFLVGAMIVYLEFIEPVYGDTEALKAQQLSLEDFLNRKKEAIAKVQNLIGAYEGQGELRQAVSLSFPEHEDAVGALAQLYGLAQASGLSLQSVSAAGGGLASQVQGGSSQKTGAEGQTPSKASFIKPIAASVFQTKLVGSYEDLKVFLSRLETNTRIFDLKSLAIQPNPASAGKFAQTAYIYDLSVATYYQAQ